VAQRPAGADEDSGASAAANGASATAGAGARAAADADARAVLVTDFDGTLTDRDFYSLVVERLLPADAPDHFAAFRAGEVTHFEALRRIFAALADRGEGEVLEVVDAMGLQPDLAGLVARLRAAGWDVVIVSAGCAWYIRHLLDRAGVDVEVHANPGHFVAGRGLVMQRPSEPRYRSEAVGVDKAAVVRDALDRYGRVAFAGDGLPDLPAARLVADHLRFGRGDLAEAAAAEGVPTRPFERWADVVEAVLADGPTEENAP
jgi:2-hydroxy-3-keto-5-methylthiopentenyl-1-phosphate phosphatase